MITHIAVQGEVVIVAVLLSKSGGTFGAVVFIV